MSYVVAIRKNATGEVRRRIVDLEWQNDVSWWVDGNMSCDCNRRLEWLRAGGPGPADDPHWNNVDHDCGDSEYSALYAELPDGTRAPLDPES